MSGQPSAIDWDLAEKLLALPCSLSEAATALGVVYPAMVRAVNKYRRDLVLPFAAAQAAISAADQTSADRTQRYERIAEVVVAHKRGEL